MAFLSQINRKDVRVNKGYVVEIMLKCSFSFTYHVEFTSSVYWRLVYIIAQAEIDARNSRLCC